MDHSVNNTIGIVEDNNILRLHLEHYLSSQTFYRIVFSEPSIEHLYECCSGVRPDYILLDIHLNKMNGLEMLEYITNLFPDSRILIITGDTNEELIHRAFSLGAQGYLLKPFTMDSLVKALLQIRDVGYYMEPGVVTSLLKALRQHAPKGGIKERFHLTGKELQIITLIKEGLSYKEIGDALNISFHTVNHHLKNAYLKLDVRSRSELVSKYFVKTKPMYNEL